jgi:hypothetical protein
MATTKSSSPSDSTQFFTKPLPAPAQTTSLVEQQLRLSVESPQLLAAIEILLPLAKAEYRTAASIRLSSGRDSLDPLTPRSTYSAVTSQPRREAYSRSSASCISGFWLWRVETRA